MHTYLWAGRKHGGEETAERINANTAQEARKILEGKGYTDLRLLKDDAMAEFTAQSSALNNLQPIQEAKLLKNLYRPTFWTVLGKTLRHGIFLWVLVAIFVWADVWNHRSPVINLSLGAFAFCAVFLVHTNRWLYQKLNEAREWHRPKSVRRIASWLERLGRLTGVKIPPHEFARMRALALAWEGNLDQALREFSAFQSTLSPWLYAMFVSGIYSAADDTEGDINYSERAVALNPNTATTHLDLAWKYLYYNQDLAKAETALEAGSRLELNELAIPFLKRNRGILAFRQGRLEEAEHFLVEARNLWLEAKGRVFSYSNLMIIHAYLSQVHAAMGNLALAQKEFAEARPWLEAVKDKLLLQACHCALQTPQTTPS